MAQSPFGVSSDAVGFQAEDVKLSSRGYVGESPSGSFAEVIAFKNGQAS